MYCSFHYSLNGFQAIFPGVNFTCNGSIQSWIFGATMEGTATSSLQRRLATINYARAQRNDVIAAVDQDVRANKKAALRRIAATPFYGLINSRLD